MRFTPTGPDTSLDQTKARLSNYQEHQATHGFSKWIILDRRLGCAIGDSGLLELREYACIDLGFRLVQHYWGKGLATEAASAWVHAAFVHPENYPSIRILEKLEFHLEKRDTVMGMNSILFSLVANDARSVSGSLAPPSTQT
jgi:[ribosomal protein S5]-alanine N-acetyltransferase